MGYIPGVNGLNGINGGRVWWCLLVGVRHIPGVNGLKCWKWFTHVVVVVRVWCTSSINVVYGVNGVRVW